MTASCSSFQCSGQAYKSYVVGAILLFHFPLEQTHLERHPLRRHPDQPHVRHRPRHRRFDPLFRQFPLPRPLRFKDNEPRRPRLPLQRVEPRRPRRQLLPLGILGTLYCLSRFHERHRFSEVAAPCSSTRSSVVSRRQPGTAAASTPDAAPGCTTLVTASRLAVPRRSYRLPGVRSRPPAWSGACPVPEPRSCICRYVGPLLLASALAQRRKRHGTYPLLGQFEEPIGCHGGEIGQFGEMSGTI